MKIAARLGALITAAALTAALSGCSAKPDTVPSDDGVEPAVVVRVVDNAFEPKDVSIKPGEAVRWEFGNNSANHDVVADDGSFVSELIFEGSYTHVFEDTGEFPYDCSIHPEMRGVVTVG